MKTSHPTPTVAEAQQLDAVRELDLAEISQVGGGYPCSYLGVEDWSLMQSYASRNYSC